MIPPSTTGGLSGTISADAINAGTISSNVSVNSCGERFNFCPVDGRRFDEEDNFCPRCGKARTQNYSPTFPQWTWTYGSGSSPVWGGTPTITIGANPSGVIW